MIKKHQDYIYLKEDYIKKPKQTFVFLKNLIKIKNKKTYLLDLGCAKGEFIFYLKNKFKNKIHLTGLDYSPKLISEAKKLSPTREIIFLRADAQKFRLKKKFDYIIASGLVSYFDDLNKFLNNSLKYLSKNGKLIILDNFNHFDVDVIVRYKDNYNKSKKFEKGWNLHSLNTIKKIIEKKKYNLKLKKFNLSFDLKKRKDPMRSWNVKIDGKKKFSNGLSQIFLIEALIISKFN